MSEHNTQKNNSIIVAYLNEIEDAERKQDCFRLLELFEQLTHETPRLWRSGIVGFGSYHYKYDSGREGDWFLTGFSPRKQNLTIYITAGFSEYADIMKNLGKFKTGSSCLYVKRLSDIDMNMLKTLIVKSVAHMKKRYE